MPVRSRTTKSKKPTPHPKKRRTVHPLQVITAPIVREDNTAVGPPLRAMVVDDFVAMEKGLRRSAVHAAVRMILRRK